MDVVPLGIDMAKDSFVAALQLGRQLVDLGTFSNDERGFTALQQQLPCQLAHAPATLHLVVEPTGGYELALVAWAHRQSWWVSVPNPKQVRAWAKGSGWRAKNDRQDARLLACYAADVQPAPEQPVPHEVSELDSLLKRRADLEQMLHQERVRYQELRHRPGVAPAVLSNLEHVIEALEAALAEVEQTIKQQVEAHPSLQHEVRRLRALPGVGAKHVLPLLVLLYRYQARTAGQGDAKGLTAYVGLDPQPHDSGRSVHKRATISQMGNADVRRLLYMGALGGVRGHNPLRHFYRQLVGRGKAKKLALVAAARRILVWAWVLFSRKTEWDPSRFPAPAI